VGLIDDYPGLRLLRSLSLGYHIAPLRGFRWKIKTFDWGFVICRRIGFGGARGWEVRVGWFAARAERSAYLPGAFLGSIFLVPGRFYAMLSPVVSIRWGIILTKARNFS